MSTSCILTYMSEKFKVISVLLFTKPAQLHVHVALRPTLPPLWWANFTENACKEHETCSKVILTLAKIITLNLESHSQFAELLQCCFRAKIREWFNFIFELDLNTKHKASVRAGERSVNVKSLCFELNVVLCYALSQGGGKKAYRKLKDTI